MLVRCTVLKVLRNLSFCLPLDSGSMDYLSQIEKEKHLDFLCNISLCEPFFFFMVFISLKSFGLILDSTFPL